MNAFQIMCVLLSLFVLGIVIGITYSSYIALAIYDEDYSLWDVIVMSFDVITGRIGK